MKEKRKAQQGKHRPEILFFLYWVRKWIMHGTICRESRRLYGCSTAEKKGKVKCCWLSKSVLKIKALWVSCCASFNGESYLMAKTTFLTQTFCKYIYSDEDKTSGWESKSEKAEGFAESNESQYLRWAFKTTRKFEQSNFSHAFPTSFHSPYRSVWTFCFHLENERINFWRLYSHRPPSPAVMKTLNKISNINQRKIVESHWRVDFSAHDPESCFTALASKLNCNRFKITLRQREIYLWTW